MERHEKLCLGSGFSCNFIWNATGYSRKPNFNSTRISSAAPRFLLPAQQPLSASTDTSGDKKLHRHSWMLLIESHLTEKSIGKSTPARDVPLREIQNYHSLIQKSSNWADVLTKHTCRRIMGQDFVSGSNSKKLRYSQQWNLSIPHNGSVIPSLQINKIFSFLNTNKNQQGKPNSFYNHWFG